MEIVPVLKTNIWKEIDVLAMKLLYGRNVREIVNAGKTKLWSLGNAFVYQLLR